MFYIRIASLLWLFLVEIGTHPNVVFLHLVRFRGWVVMKNNETCNALKCLKPSGLIDWINCRFCNGWGYMKCANLSRTEARSLDKLKWGGRKSEIVLGSTGHGNKFESISSKFSFEWTKFEFSKNRNKFDSLCSNFELSIKRASDISPFDLVPRRPVEPLMFSSW